MAERRRWVISATVVAAIIVVIVVINLLSPNRNMPGGTVPSGSMLGAGNSAATGPEAKSDIPPFNDVAQWINSPALTPKGLKGKVVLVDFWTYSCVNCIRTLPYLKSWYQKYTADDFIIVGIHSPEFDFEKVPANVRKAVAKYGVSWPVAMDNDMTIWQEYGNHYWPHEYLFDANGNLRHQQIGEGGYDETEDEIRSLLTESGHDVTAIPTGGVVTDVNLAMRTTREIYAGSQYQGGNYLGNDVHTSADGVGSYTDPGTYADGHFYLDGSWQLQAETARFAPTSAEAGAKSGAGAAKGNVLIQYSAKAVYAVMGRADESQEPVRVDVKLDGKPVPQAYAADDIQYDSAGASYVMVTQSRMYDVVDGPADETHDLSLAVTSPQFLFYTFTFGG